MAWCRTSEHKEMERPTLAWESGGIFSLVQPFAILFQGFHCVEISPESLPGMPLEQVLFLPRGIWKGSELCSAVLAPLLSLIRVTARPGQASDSLRVALAFPFGLV